ncbi:MAG: hypothetical protein RLY14_2855 [Planctomycetota bacterium]
MFGNAWSRNRRDFLVTSALGGMLGSSRFSYGSQDQQENGVHHVELQCGDLTAVIGDNAAHREHRAGYNGVWVLRHREAEKSIFVPGIAGLNLEHILTGARLSDAATFFEPRNSPMELKIIDETSVELFQPATFASKVESRTRFTLKPPHYLDMKFTCIPRSDIFSAGYLALFWASYINAPEDKSMYFLGGLDSQRDHWTQLSTQFHLDQSTVRHRSDEMDLVFAEDGRDALFKEMSRLRFDAPFFYGHFEKLIWLVMFDRTDGLRLTHSPSGGGGNDLQKTSNPAWDFQFVVQKPTVGREYGFNVRTVLRPRCTREEIVDEFEVWKKERG